MKIGLIVNPVAGMGAKLAWKGTDNVQKAWDLILEGFSSESFAAAKRALETVTNNEIHWIVVNDEFKTLGKMIYQIPLRSTREHTQEATRKIIEEKVDLIVFVGGDGTAADIAPLTYPDRLPIIGVPAGVKIFSGAFLHNPEDLGNFLETWTGDIKVVEIEDLDEDAYRKGRIIPKTITEAYIPVFERVQEGKSSFHAKDSVDVYGGIAQRISEEGLMKGTILVGGGSTLYEIFMALGLQKSLLGVDVFQDGIKILDDATFDDLLEIDINEIWVTPIGRQGHLFGRGNRQIPPEIIKKVGKLGIRVFATPEKIQNTPTLYIDTGDPILDKDLKGYYKVIVGFHETVVRRAD